jgi:DNA-binding SARP family transcriptional activator
MEFRILGPLEVRDNGRIVDVGAAKQRALLAMLLLNANRVVSTDALIESLWGERPPETAGKALQVYVSQLRKALGRDRIVTRSPGYELLMAPDELDLQRFERLFANEEYGEALRLWRGSPLAEFAYEPFAQSEIARIDELGQACLERRIDSDLSAGRHAELVGELEALVRAHPLRERLRAQLMLALYRSGRQADALDAYQAGRALLSDELGLEPAAELKELQRAILAHDPALALPEEGSPELAPRAGEPADESRPRDVRKTVTVLFCDVTPTGRSLDPEPLRRLSDRGLEELLAVLDRHGATVERSIGGAVTAVFGIPSVHEDDALRATRAAVEMLDRLASVRGDLERNWGAWLELRAGIGTGEVVAGGDGEQPYAAGEPVQAALRLYQSAQPGELLVDERTRLLVRDLADVEDSDGHWRLVRVQAPTSGFKSRFDSPMVGRERERRRLKDAFEQATVDQSCQLFTILGTPGVGKSRLVQEFVDDVATAALVARGRCLPYGEGITYWPVLETIRDAADIDDADSAPDSLDKLTALLLDVEDAEVVAQRLGEVIGLSDHTSSPDETFGAVRTFFEALARRRPVVLVFDDIHWGEATFLDLVDHLAELTHGAPVLLVCVARPELYDVRPLWGGGKVNATSVHLEPLSEAESVQLVDNLTGSIQLDETTRQQIVDGAGGNPLFVEEMLALLLEDGRVGVGLEVPPTIQALLAERLDRLSDDERAAIEAAAVEGKVFHESSVAELLAGEPPTVRECLTALTRKELVRVDRPVFSGERAFAFRHLLIRDAAYESTSKEARARLHERHAAWLENVGAGALELDEIIGYHYEQAFEYGAELGAVDDHGRTVGRAAAERLGTAGRRAFMRSDVPAGVNLVSRAVALLRADDPLRVELVPNVRAVQGVSELSELSWADRVLTEAVEAAATTGDRRLAGHALVQRGLLRLFTEADVTSQEILQTARQAIDAFEVLGDELGLARAWRLAAQGHYLARAAEASAQAAERALEHARRANDRFEQVEVLEWLLVALLFGPCPAAEGSDRCRRLLRDFAGHPELEARVAGALAWFEAAQGHVEPTRELLAEARAAMDDHGEIIGFVMFYVAGTLTLADERAEAEEVLRVGYDTLGALGRTGHYGAIALRLAQLSYTRGDLEDAEKYLEEVAGCLRANDVWDQSHWRAERAKILARRGEFAAGEELVREAVRFAAASDFLTAQADALADMSEVLELVGKRDEAIRTLEAAIELYLKKQNVVAGNACRARLEALKSPR